MGFGLVQDRHAKEESEAAQLERARILASYMLGMKDGTEVSELARQIVQVANATEKLGQFDLAE